MKLIRCNTVNICTIYDKLKNVSLYSDPVREKSSQIIENESRVIEKVIIEKRIHVSLFCTGKTSLEY